ncbi:Histone acetyltransferase protein [Dioscorea alata]|uniref:Histone acetyltransferase protein n=1 Tax=Dioscorea alata TaxID=55571 RepID=A0ACB7U7H7_DIOAL|nr:Histone acetyltransferase protein [Dioscorea alata]
MKRSNNGGRSCDLPPANSEPEISSEGRLSSHQPSKIKVFSQMLCVSLTFRSLGATSQREEIPNPETRSSPLMGLMEPPPAEEYAVSAAPSCNGTASAVNGGDPPCGKHWKVGTWVGGSPLEVGTWVMCWWRNQKLHPVSVMERHKITYHLVDFL